MKNDKVPVVPRELVLPFALVTCLFALWGFANDLTNPLVKAFKDIFVISNMQSSFVQMAFYGGYATMALPAALFIRRFSYKSGILVGLALFATGALSFIPAASMANFNLFLAALYVLTFGLAFLETTANPYILSMGDARTATRRLNLAQAFNPIGSLTGMVVAIVATLVSLQVQDFRNDVSQYRAERAAEFRVDETAAAYDHGGGVVQAVRMGTHIGDDLREFVENGNLILGICNGFQALANMGILPGIEGDYRARSVSVTFNDCGNFRNQWITMKIDPDSPCVFTKGLATLDSPVRHGGENSMRTDPF